MISFLFATVPARAENDKDKDKGKAKESGPVLVLFETSMGNIVLELDSKKAPITVKNFLGYVDNGFYDSTIFHRVIKDFVVQGGGFTVDMQKKPTGMGIQNEWKNGLKNKRGTISMARLGGQANSATTQFFLNVRDNDMLDSPRDGAGYAVFGKVIDGMDVVDKIRKVKTGIVKGMGDVPIEPVILIKAKRITPEELKK